MIAVRVVLNREGFAPWKSRLEVSVTRAPRCAFKIDKIKAARKTDGVTFGKYHIQISNENHAATIKYVVMKGTYVPGTDGKDIDWSHKEEAKVYSGPFDIEGFETVVQVKAFAQVPTCTHTSLAARALLRPLITYPDGNSI